MGNEKLLYVDDEEINLQLFELNFRNNYDLITCANPIEALKIIENENLKVVITDYKMPFLNGMQLIEKIKLVKPNIVCIILSGFMESDVVTDKSKVFRYIMKPYKKDNILSELKEAFLLHSNSGL